MNASAPPPRGVLAYLTSQYGRASDTFIRGEVRHLRALGHVVHTFSVRRAEEAQAVSDEVLAEQRSTCYLVERGAPALLAALLRTALRSPLRFASTLGAAWHASSPGIAARLRHLAYLAEAALLANELRRRRVEHLHNHLAEASAVVAMLAARLAGIPWSLTVHGPYEFLHAERWRLGEKIATTAFTACISEFCRSQCLMFAPPEAWPKLRIVRCGIGDAFLAGRPEPVPDVARLVCVGRLCAEKGQLLLVDVVARLVGRWPQLEMVLVGDGPTRAAIERRIDELGVRPHFRLLGWRGSEDVRREVLAARAFVLPTFAEGLPVVLMEALALGRPVVSSWVAGIPELVEAGTSGWLVPPGSIDGLADAIDALLRTPTARLDEMAAAGARRVAERHDPAREAAQLSELFHAARGRPRVAARAAADASVN